MNGRRNWENHFCRSSLEKSWPSRSLKYNTQQVIKNPNQIEAWMVYSCTQTPNLDFAILNLSYWVKICVRLWSQFLSNEQAALMSCQIVSKANKCSSIEFKIYKYAKLLLFSLRRFRRFNLLCSSDHLLSWLFLQLANSCLPNRLWWRPNCWFCLPTALLLHIHQVSFIFVPLHPMHYFLASTSLGFNSFSEKIATFFSSFPYHDISSILPSI